ncbi:phosphatidylglycerol lysyltransferase domain-containing protein [Streptomyces sp. NPDC054765]
MTAPAALSDDEAVGVLRRHGRHSSAFLTMNTGIRRLSLEGLDGFAAYRESGRRHLFELCGPVCAYGDRERVLVALLDRARGERRRVGAVQLSQDDALLHAGHGFVVNQLGASFSIALADHSLRGQRMVKVRNMVNRARREGVTVQETPPGEADDPARAAALDRVDAAWLRAKGRHVKELDFLIGERGGPGRPYRRLFTAAHEGRTVGYVSYSPVFGERAGWLYDLTRRSPEAPPGTVDLLFATALQHFQEESCGWLHLGFTPFVQFGDPVHSPRPSSPALRRVLELLGSRGRALYPAAAQESFKLKWRPQHIEPEYLAFQNGVSVAAVWHLLRLTRTV